MKLNSKADTILKLTKYSLNFLIPETYVFKTNEWKVSKNKIINIIQKKFKSKIVIRSWSSDEICKIIQAGKYLILGVNPKDRGKLKF